MSPVRWVCVVAVMCASLTTADIYFHIPRGSNNRLDEKSAARKNANRLFDSQVCLPVWCLNDVAPNDYMYSTNSNTKLEDSINYRDSDKNEICISKRTIKTNICCENDRFLKHHISGHLWLDCAPSLTTAPSTSMYWEASTTDWMIWDKLAARKNANRMFDRSAC